MKAVTTTDLAKAKRGDTITFRSEKYNKGRKVCAAVDIVDARTGEIVFRAMNNRSIKTINVNDLIEFEFSSFQ